MAFNRTLPKARPGMAATGVAPHVSRVAQFRPLTTINYPGAAGPTRTPIPRDFCLQDLNLYLSGIITVGAAAATAVKPEAAMSLIRNIRIEGSSGSRQVGEIKNADAAALFRLQHILLGTPGLHVDPVVGIGANPFSADIRVDFGLTAAENLRDTLLRSNELNSLDLVIDWGAATDLLTPDVGPPATTLAVAATVVLGARELRDSVSMGQRYKLHKVTTVEQVNPGAGVMTFDLRGRNTLRGILIKQFTQAAGATWHTPVATVINSLRLRLNGDVREDWNPIQALEAENKVAFSVEAMPAGYAFLDLLHGGHRDLALNTNQYSTVELLIATNTVADSRIRVYPIEIVA